jgi:hypothetical protein
MKGILSGRKTYIAAAAYAAAAWLSLLTGEEILGAFAGSVEDAIRVTFEAAIVIFLRQGVAKVEKKADPNARA